MRKLLMTVMYATALFGVVGCRTCKCECGCAKCSCSDSSAKQIPPNQDTQWMMVDSLVVNVKPREGTRSEFAASLGRKLGTECEMRGFAKPNGAPDATVKIDVSCKEKSRFGNFVVYGGTADVYVTVRGRQIAIKSFATERNQSAAVGADKAEQSVVDELSEKISAWLEQMLPPGQSIELK